MAKIEWLLNENQLAVQVFTGQEGDPLHLSAQNVEGRFNLKDG